jgi:hypothetical protein
MAKKELDPYYSKANPLGPYSGAHRPDAADRPKAEYIEGASNKDNLKAWAARASANSGPKIAPGLGKGRDRDEEQKHKFR